MRRAFVNQQNTEGQTALHLACRSGRPETVQILLEAGAEVNLMDETELNRSLFKECAQLEAEQTLWDHIQDTYSYNAAGVLVNDTKRPCSDQDGARGTGGRSPKSHRSHWSYTIHDSIRLDAILDILVLHDPIPLAKSRSFSFAFYEAVSNHHEYTVDCFSRLWTRMCPDIPFNHSNRLEYLTSKYRLEATQQALREYSNSDDSDHPSKSIEFLEELLFGRQYDILEESIAKQGDPFRINRDARSLLHSLVKWGFKDILARVCPRDAILHLDDHEWC
jgi:ankyrin repeat protein